MFNSEVRLLSNTEVIEVDITKKVLINGRIENMKVYRVPLNLLHYNNQNDRIATWISKYESENGDITNNNKDNYNRIIEDFIIQSNKPAFEKTKNNINLFEQQEAGVVLDNGIIIDGNRRFTCLRKLYEETNDPRFYYFETVILPASTSIKEIKRLELSLQHGKDEKIDYDPIEKLVGIYRDIIKEKTLTVEEYARSIDERPLFVEKLVERANLMVEFLEHINAKEQFHIAREIEIDGPIIEVANIKRKIVDEDEAEKVKVVLFDVILQKPEGDITRMVRNIGSNVLCSPKKDEYLDKMLDLSEKIQDKLNRTDILSTDFIRNEIRNNEELKQEMYEINDKYKREGQYDQIRNLPLKQIEQCTEIINSVDKDTVSKMSDIQKEEFKKYLLKVKNVIGEIEDAINQMNIL